MAENKNKTEKVNPAPAASDDETYAAEAPEQIRIRAEKRAKMLAEGRTPYPVHVDISATISEVRQKYPDLQAGEETEDYVGLAGRVRLMRSSGKLAFATLQEGNGSTIQIMVSEREFGPESMSAYRQRLTWAITCLSTVGSSALNAESCPFSWILGS